MGVRLGFGMMTPCTALMRSVWNVVIRGAVGVDCSPDLLDEAKRHAYDAELPLEYVQMDVNSGAFPDGDWDLVVNVAAAHRMSGPGICRRQGLRTAQERLC